MRIRHAVGLAAATVSAVLGLPAITAHADAGGVLNVDNRAAANCSDAGTGTAARPYCTLQAAVDAAQPGQTVQVAPDTDFTGEVRVTRSGTPGHPIVINGAPIGMYTYSHQPSLTSTTGHVFTVDGASDVVIRGFLINNTAQPVVIKDSSRIQVDQLMAEWYLGKTLPAGSAALRVTGHSDQVTVTRSVFYANAGVVVESGSQRTTFIGNDIGTSQGGGLSITDGPGTVVVNNTVVGSNGPGIALLGASAGSVVENNIVVSQGTIPRGAPISVAAGSTAATKVDYNIVHPLSGTEAYSWGGAGHLSPAAFTAATGQGAHDVDAAIAFTDNLFHRPGNGDTAAIDSADPDVPGLPDTDLYGSAVVDNPLVAGTGPHGSLRDRGAAEVQGLTEVGIDTRSADHPAGPGMRGALPYAVEFTATPYNTWPTGVTYSYDFGDGSAPLVTTEVKVRHTYTQAGVFTPYITATDSTGHRVVSYPGYVEARPDAPLTPVLKAWPSRTDPLGFDLNTNDTTSPWQIKSYSMDFGDGTSDSHYYDGFGHTYARPGTYTVTLTATDWADRTASTSLQVTAAYTAAGFTAIAPVRVADTRVTNSRYTQRGAWSSLDVFVRENEVEYNNVRIPVVPQGATAVVLNLTATGATGNGFLSATPNRGERPTTSNVNYGPNQDVANVVTVPIGEDGNVTIANTGGAVGVVVDVLGYYKADSTGKFSGVAPARLLDTRKPGDAPIGQDAVRPLKVTGSGGVPANATSVVLNVTAADATAESFLTAYPAGTSRPSASNLNVRPGQIVPNQVIVPVGTDGTVNLYNHLGSTQVIVDVFGYYSPDGKGLFTPVVPARLLDSRQGGGALGQGGSRTVGGVPAGAFAAVANITATGTTAATHLIVHATGTAVPDTSNLNPVPGRDVPNQVTTPVSADGRFDIVNHMGSTHVIADLFGYFTNG
ncbi:PKD domain-containing protein [Kitasatospora sp. NBC_00240]|uniref:PKD domain-containing protein n=1 Tax=Kitasatospora sp. NBC_00240 TaxID=2903567 RepID=UPI002258B4E7|nr:PKD domain-containing protein [Kitasatospora sp. NBC_00240]MCX5211674.1 PKD domain-containing protein [Kitasatospora sp. NBC_00240]